MITEYADMRLERDDGQVMMLWGHAGKGWFLPAGCLEGFGDHENDIEAFDNVLTDGATIVSRRMPELDRTVSQAIWTGPNPDSARAAALSFLNPRHDFRAHVTYRGRTRWCEGVLTGVKCPMERLDAPPKLTFTLLCLDPHMRDERRHDEAFGDARPMFGFPYVSHMPSTRWAVGAPASVRVYDGKNTVFNAGDLPTYYKIRCEFSGEVKNPVFTKDGKKLGVADVFQAGDVLEVDFEAAPPKVEKNGANAIKTCTRDSSFTGMVMQVGENVFDYTCDDPDNRRGYMRVVVSWHDKYLGI